MEKTRKLLPDGCGNCGVKLSVYTAVWGKYAACLNCGKDYGKVRFTDGSEEKSRS